MKQISIRKINLEDLETLQKLSEKTFKETFEKINSKEDMENYLKASFNLDQLAFEINTKDSEFYFAESNDEVLGYLKINFGLAQTEIKDEFGCEIQRIYILQKHQNKRAGQFLLESALQIAKDRKCKYIWLGVWEKNDKAISFYRKNRFFEFDKHIFELGTDKQIDIMMKLEI